MQYQFEDAYKQIVGEVEASPSGIRMFALQVGNWTSAIALMEFFEALSDKVKLSNLRVIKEGEKNFALRGVVSWDA